MLEQLKEEVCRENLRLRKEGLVVLTWGNVSARDPATGLVVIKPSGVPYDGMTPADMVVVGMDGKVVEGGKRPSSDTPTHLEIYRAFPEVCGVVHTHSVEATARAQAMRPLPCYGTTHADAFDGEIPVTRYLTEGEVAEAYEINTGKIIVETLSGRKPLECPGILVGGHGPFTWGASAAAAVDAAVTLEAVARMARLTEQMSVSARTPHLPPYVLEKHHSRKHGPNAYYGQAKETV